MATRLLPAISPEPYGSYVLAERKSGVHITDVEQLEILDQYLDLVQLALVAAGTSVSGTVGEYGPVSHNGVVIRGRWFETSTSSKWEPSLKDSTNELLLISVAKNRVAFYASDSGLRKILLSNLGNSLAPMALATLSKISSTRLIAAFLDDKQLKAMWLSGTHRSVQVKADSKILSGSDLKFALDPLGDSSYLAAAARQAEMGVSLRGSAVWTRPHKTIVSFAEDVQKIFGYLETSGTKEATLPVLANELSSFASVQSPFDFDVSAPEALRLKAQQRKSADLTSQYYFQISASTAVGSPPYAFDLAVKPWSSTSLVGILNIQVEPAFTVTHSESVIEFQVTPVTAPLQVWMTEVIAALLTQPEIFRVFYGSGHAITAGALSVARPMDIDFADWKWLSFALMPYHSVAGTSVWVHEEKPEANELANIWQSTTDRSLFSWFVRTLNDPNEAAKMGLEPLQLGSRDVWIFCDDDAGEVADFVHVFAPPVGIPKITLIHIKGAHSESAAREMVAGPYEVVCGQAVKNLRYLTAERLIDRLEKRIFDDDRPLWNSALVMGTAPDGNRDDFFNVLCDIDEDACYAVLIIQPHVMQLAYGLPKNAPLAKTASLGSVQLRTLLFGVKANAAAVSASFHVVGCA
ncbi:hypothetical protein SKZ59_10370 [Janthinobacterium sp. GMG2]|uniref:hypothetical protein n=1 Tax=Janthinobacterium sp. GMG2 TaxID=3096606 RepID=UPI0029F5983D|nr:hypothetical protein [Janthinobacterium sp. GMG2]MDX8122179.1 hypothetical protein [Janthinobacterium sp. GMG2]